MRAVRRILVVAAVTALTSPAVAYARGGGGSHGFGGGGHGGGGSSGGGGGYHGSGGGFGGGGRFVVVGVLVVIALVVWIVLRARKGRTGRDLNTVSDRTAHHSDAQARERAAMVEARVEAIADTDATFDLDTLKQRAAWLYVTAQQAWTDRDHDALQRIMSPVLYGKWAEELADYQFRDEINVVEIVSGPTVELVEVANRVGEVNDTVTFRISATLNDYVRTTGGGRIGRTDNSTSPVEYWTLRKNDAGEWVVASVEQAAEGAHHLTAALETDSWDQKSVAREAVIEVAQKTAVQGVGASELLGLTGISWSADADAAAGDISVLDGRFDRAVLEVAVERFLEEWAMNDGSLDFTPVRTPNRTVMRNATIDSVQVRSLVSSEPIVFQVAVSAQGVYYEVDRSTEEVLQGDAHKRRPISFTFDLRLDEAGTQGWTVISGGAQ